MKNITPLIDSNILLDVFLFRVDFMEESSKVLDYCMSLNNRCLISAHSITNMYYIMRKEIKDDLRREMLLSLFDFFEIVSVDEQKLRSALLRSDFADFEDCLQNECAVEEKADCIITRNKKDFEGADVKVYTPGEFIEYLEEM
mgnify:CR=1 FL=1